MNARVLVTGGTIRLGLAIAAHLRDKGYEVYTTSHRKESGADFIVDFRKAWTLPKFDAIVNNAALFTGSEADLTAVNYLAPKRTIDEKMAVNIVNILDSRVICGPRDDYGAYARTKRMLLEETVKRHGGVRVNGVAPGPVIAPVAAKEPAGPTPLGRPTPEAVAEAVRFLLESEFISGCVIPVDGGQHLL